MESTNCVTLAVQATTSLKTWIAAYQWAVENKKLLQRSSNTSSTYLLFLHLYKDEKAHKHCNSEEISRVTRKMDVNEQLQRAVPQCLDDNS